ncbi:MAG: hypothetical protein ABI305_05480 [Tepidiformaceae bacterium]
MPFDAAWFGGLSCSQLAGAANLERMQGLGVREVVGLAVLGVALVIGYLFLDPSAGESSSAAPGQIYLGQPVPPTVKVEPTATPTPDAPSTRAKNPATGWFIQFYELSGADELANGQGFTPTLDLAFPGAPFPDFKDDSWLATATANFPVDGRTQITIEHDGDLRVFVDDKEVLHDEDASSANTVTVKFDHAPGTARVRIEERDVSGPFELKFVE